MKVAQGVFFPYSSLLLDEKHSFLYFVQEKHTPGASSSISNHRSVVEKRVSQLLVVPGFSPGNVSSGSSPFHYTSLVAAAAAAEMLK